MSKTLRLVPGEATQEVVAKIKMDASQPAPPFASTVPASKHNAGGKNSLKNTKNTSFHNKQPK